MKNLETQEQIQTREQCIKETRAQIREVLFKFGDKVSIVLENDLRPAIGEHGETGLKSAENKVGDEAVLWTDVITGDLHTTILPARYTLMAQAA